MALEEQMAKEQSSNQNSNMLSEEEERDLNIGVMLAQDLIDSGGIEVIQKAEQSKDPGQVIGQFLMQLVSQMDEMLPEQLKLSKKIYFAVGGWIEQISDYLQEEYGISKEIMDRAEIYMGTTAQQMAATQANKQLQPQQPAAPQQPAMPNGGM